MAEKENNDFGLSLKDMGLDNVGGNNIDDLLADDVSATDEKNLEKATEPQSGEDDFIDFNDFSIDDLDTALSKFGDEDDGDGADAGVAKATGGSVDDILNMPNAGVEAKPQEIKTEQYAEKTAQAGADDISQDAFFSEYSQEEEDKQMLGNLIWYDGTIGEKVYEISISNMPEFLDYDSSIKTIHVNIESPYGWNVFFENGVFMNLMDLKEYQERHGNLPGTNGKIIYGGRMSSFEKIERIVVYNKPRYFSYNVKR